MERGRPGSREAVIMGVEARPTISVIVPVHRGGAAFVRCLASVAANRPAPLEIVVVADGALSEDVGAARAAGARVCALPERSGPARARNAGAREARGEILFFVDADVLLPAAACERVAHIFARAGDAPDAVIGSYDDRPAAANFLSQYKNLQHHYVHQHGRERASTFWGACGAIRRDVFLEAGGFDERYRRPCIEDIELGCRLARAGRTILLCRELQVTHLKAWTVASLLEADLLYRALPWMDLILRERRAPDDLNLSWRGRASALLATAAPAALVAYACGARSPVLLAGALVAGAAVLVLNAPFYRFLRRRRGTGFMLRAIPWHWFYHVYSTFGCALGIARHLLRVKSAPWLRPYPAPAPLDGRAPAGV